MATDVEAVLHFLRSNGFGEAEVALRRDLLERDRGRRSNDEADGDDELCCFEYEKFLFPTPPPVRIHASPHVAALRLEEEDEEEFVSLRSSTSDLFSSEFASPHGRRSHSRSADGDSEASSSDRMSQFGTAREYHGHDFDVYNNLWYDEKEDGMFLTPSFRVLELEDKFITPPEPTALCFGDGPEDLLVGSEGFLRNDLSNDYLHKCSGFESNRGVWNDLPDMRAECLEPHSETKEMVHGSCKLSAKCEDGNDSNSRYLPRIEFDAVKKMDKQDFGEERKSGSIQCGEGDKNSGSPGCAINQESNADCEDMALMAENPDDDYEIFDLRIIHRRNRTGFEESKDLPIVLNTVIAGRYYVTEYLGSAAFSKVIQAHDLHTGVNVCLKIIKNDKDFFDQSLDEIKLLKLVNKYDPADQHHILRLYDYFYHQEHLFIVCELLRANLYEFQKFNEESGDEPYFTFDRLQIITRQCLEALQYLHDLGMIHCDLKPENILIKSYSRSQIKVIDLGSSCFKSDNLCLYVQSRSYRAPEVILGLPYDEKIDIWSLGCILAELCSGEVLFPNEPIVMILARVIGLLGLIDVEMLENGQETSKYFTEEFDLYYVNETDQLEYVIPQTSTLGDHLGVSDIGFLDFLKCLLEIDPKRRPSAREAMDHPWLSYDYSLSF
ncbi:hypothetical protein MLD38_024132 [Melastoma candidum]|uniref:Uncharacterized protein n=1 Tax=Melastoma candidum TaxID=119954 RepID=A0ACB9NR55_9MYRT|nr:hypothetical protein MLD38_024132 [Melastoma candidum]